MTTALVTDSTAYLPGDLLAGADVRVVPLHVVIGGRDHREGVDIDAGAVARALHAFTPVSTSRPAPAAFAEAYEACAAAGADAVVSVHLSGEMSSTVGGAELAAATSPVPVTVVDSRSLGMAMGYAVLAGARAAAAGAGPDDVAHLVRATCAAATAVFYVDTLEYLRRGGRIGTATALPEGATGVDVAVHHLDSADRAERLAERLRARLPDAVDVRVVGLGAVVGAHVGPGTLAVAVVPRLPLPTG